MTLLHTVGPDPDVAAAFVTEVLGQKLWSKQLEVLRAVFGGPHRTTCVASCTGAGKTKVAADLALTWLFTGPNRMVITTAPTGRQVKELLWKEIRLSYKAAAERGCPLGGHMPPSDASLRVDDGWLCIGFSSDEETNVQGFHSEGGTLAILDEAVGVPEVIWDAVEATLTGEHDRLLAIANPASKSGRFGALWSQKSTVNCIQISAFETPNLAAGYTVIPGMTTREWVEDKRIKWGTKSPLWRTKVMGEFPEEDDQGLIPVAWLDRAVARWRDCQGKRPSNAEPGEAGLDVARFGEDKNVLAPIFFAPDKTVVGALVKTAKQSTMETVGMVVVQANDLGLQHVRVDAVGLGAGVFDRLQELGTPEVTEMQSGRAPTDGQKYLNARAEWFWSLREALMEDAAVPLALPPDDDLAFQATTLRWKLDSRGRIQVESKDDWRARTKRSSTDELDAVAMALARGAGTLHGVAPAWS